MALIEALSEVLNGANPRPTKVWGRVAHKQGLSGYNADELNAVTPAVFLLALELADGGDGSRTIDLLEDKENVKEMAHLYIIDNIPVY